VLEIGGLPVLALVSGDIEQAKALCSETWFVEELASYRTCGKPIWDGEAELVVRHADAREAMELEIAIRLERARKEYEGYVFAFLVPVDAIPQ
jgi:hypothetical protein